MAITNDEHWVSPTIKKSSLIFPLSLDKKIDIFTDRVKGWQLSIALDCYNKIQHGGFGSLYIAFSYFELIARYHEGSTDHRHAGKAFKKGFLLFSQQIGFSSNANYKLVRDLVYEGARCGLYHVGMTSKGVYIDGGRAEVFEYDSGNKRLVIEPELLIKSILKHFEDYISGLKSKKDSNLLDRFERKFDHDILPQLT